MASSEYKLLEVNSKATEAEFFAIVKRLYKGDKNFICPLESTIRGIFDPKKNKLFNGGDAIRWIVQDSNGQTVGRIGAFYNLEKANAESQPTGGCGFFECIDNYQVAEILFDASRDWLKSKGMEAMDGPINFGQRDSWWGVLVEGFDYEPLFENPYNPPYYQGFFEQYGFKDYFQQYSYIWNVDDHDLSPKIHARAARLAETPGYSFRHVEKHELDDAAETFRTIYNKAWSMFSGVTPMEAAEAKAIMNSLKPIVDVEILYFAYFEDTPIGFFIMVPDLNKVLKQFNGKFGPLQKLKFLWDLKVRRTCDRIFGMIFAITPEYQGRGVESGLMSTITNEYLHSPKNRYKSLELAWMGDFNPVMNHMIVKYVCATRHKRHITYRYLFDREKEFERCPQLKLRRRGEL